MIEKLRILRHPVVNIRQQVNVSCNPGKSPYQLTEALMHATTYSPPAHHYTRGDWSFERQEYSN